MSETTFNPYPQIGSYYAAGLDYIINNIGDDPSVDDLVNTVYTYISGLSWFETTPGFQETEIKAFAYNAINSFIDGQMGNYNAGQYRFISMLTGPSFVNGLTLDTVQARILDIEDKVGTSDLPPEQQTPLFLSTMMGKTGYVYFISAISTGMPANWAPYFDAALVSPLNNLQFWLAASMKGALIGANPSPGCKGGMIDPSTTPAANQLIQSLISALTITFGRIGFNWIPRIKDMSSEKFSDTFSSFPLGGGGTAAQEKVDTTETILTYNPTLGYSYWDDRHIDDTPRGTVGKA